MSPDASNTPLVVFKLMRGDDPAGDFVRIGFSAARARELATLLNEAADAV